MHERAWVRFLNSKNVSPRTVVNYLDATRALKVWLSQGWCDRSDMAELTPQDLQAFFAEQTSRLSGTTAAIRYRALQQFYKWAAAEDVRPDNPMTRVPRPMVPVTAPEILTLDQLKALLGACAGKTFVDRRDNAIMRVFMEPGGARLSELTTLDIDAIDLSKDVLTVYGKGRKERSYPFGAKTGLALDRYLRLRAGHKQARLTEALWLGKKGALGNSGVQQMLRRRASQVGIPRLYPHMFRHTAAHRWLAAGGSESAMLPIFGWSSSTMVQVYGRSAAVERAVTEAREMGLGDQY